jgi:hypothetical protein
MYGYNTKTDRLTDRQSQYDLDLDLEVHSYSSRFLQFYNSSSVFKEYIIVIIILQFFKLKIVRVYYATVINILEQFNKWLSLHIMTSHNLIIF